MILQGTQYKIDWLEKNINSNLYTELEKCYDQFVEKHCEEMPKVKRYHDVLKLDLIYCICVHYFWHKLSIFEEILTENFSADFLISRKIVQELIAELIDKYIELNSYKNDTIINPTDRDFLKFIFVQTVTNDENSIILDKLGLGAEILNKLKSVASSIGRKSESKFEFLPNIDSEYEEIILQLSDEFRNAPWIFSSYKIMYDVLDIPFPWRTLMWEKSGSWLLKLLVELELNGNINADAFIESAKKIFPIFSEEDCQLYSKQLISYLIEKGYLFQDEKSRNKFIFRLTTEGYKSTAQYYYYRVYKKESLPLKAVHHLNGFWQKQIIENISIGEIESLKLMFQNSDGLKAEALLSTIKSLKMAYSNKEIGELIENKLKVSQNPWVKSVLKESLQLLGDEILTVPQKELDTLEAQLPPQSI